MQKLLSTLLALALVAGCGKDSTSPEPGAASTQATVGTSGGTLEVNDGASVFRIEILPNALREDVRIEIREVEPVGDAIAAFELLPAGLRLDEPARLTLQMATLPDGFGLAIGGAGDLTYLQTNRGEGILAAQLPVFGFVADDLPAKAGPGQSTVQIVPTNCTILAAAAEQARDELLANNHPVVAARLLATGSALLSEEGCQVTADQFLAEAQSLICAAYASAVQNADVLAVEDFEMFKSILTPVVSLGSAMEFLGVECASSPLHLVVQEAAQELVIFYEPEAAALGTQDYERFFHLHREIRDVIDLMANAQLLGASITGQLRLQALDPLRSLLRDAAFRTVQAGGDHYFLARLTEHGLLLPRRIVPTRKEAKRALDFEDEDVFEDIQYAATRVELVTRDESGTVQTTAFAGGGTVPGNTTDQVSLNWSTEGRIDLTGTLRSLTCWGGAPAQDELVVEFEGIEVAVLPHPASGDFLADDVSLSLRNMASNADIELDASRSYDLLLKRRRPDCPDCECAIALFGPTEFDLVRVTLPPMQDAGEASFTSTALMALASVEQDTDEDTAEPDGLTAEAAVLSETLGGASSVAELEISGSPVEGLTVRAVLDVFMDPGPQKRTKVEASGTFEIDVPMRYDVTIDIDDFSVSTEGDFEATGSFGEHYSFRQSLGDGPPEHEEQGDASGLLAAGSHSIAAMIESAVVREGEEGIAGSIEVTVLLVPQDGGVD